MNPEQPGSSVEEQQPVTQVIPLLSKSFNSDTLHRIACYFEVPPSLLDDYFSALPIPEEAEVLRNFSRYTRQIAGEDPRFLNEQADEKRLKLQTNFRHNESGQVLIANPKKRKRSAIVEDGRPVAAKINDTDWILMNVLRYVKKTRTYILEDADELVNQKEDVEVSKDVVIPLSCSEYWFGPFPERSRVLAVSPDTTCFYQATVIKCIPRNVPTTTSSRRNAPTPPPLQMYDYLVQFDEDNLTELGEKPIHQIAGEFVTDFQ